MKVRFIEYVPIGDSYLNLFFRQERDDQFMITIRAKGEQPALLKMQREGEKTWEINSQTLPEWAKLVAPYLQGILEHKLELINYPDCRNCVRDRSQIILNR